MTIAARFQVQRGSFALDVDLKIPGQGVTALFGRSGSGKTTLLRCIAGLEHLHGGALRFFDEVWQSDAGAFKPVHQRPLGFVFQEPSLFPHIRVIRNLEYGLKRVAVEQRKVGWDETIELLGLSALLQRFPDELSGGQKQRVAIARALLTSPGLLLMDEPMASLDEISKSEILPYLERLRDELSIPVVYVSHNIEEVMRLADHMIVLSEGQVLAQGPLQEILTRADLPLAYTEGAAAVIHARVTAHDVEHQLTELSFSGGTLLMPGAQMPAGSPVRVRIMARDVGISLSQPTDTSVLNYLPVQVQDIFDDPHPGYSLVRLQAGETTLLARVSQRSSAMLGLRPGMAVFAVVKSAAMGG